MNERLDGFILDSIDSAEELNVGSEEYANATKGITSLISARNEMYQSELESFNKMKEFEERQKDRRTDTIIRTAAEVAKVVVPIVGVGMLARMILRFDADENSPLLNRNAWSLLTKLIH